MFPAPYTYAERCEMEAQRMATPISLSNQHAQLGGIQNAINRDALRVAIEGLADSVVAPNKSEVDILKEEVTGLKEQMYEMSKQLDFIKSLVVESDSNASRMAKVVRSLGKHNPIIIDPADDRGKNERNKT